MENASKALTMAAGVLIAVLIIVLIYVLLNNLSDLSKQDEQQLQAKQTAAFNKEYESYDKKLMRGTELITLINKAIANNEKYDNEHEIYDVNIVFTLKSDVSKCVITSIPFLPSLMEFQKSLTLFPTGVIAPNPVITTLLFIIYLL